MMNTRSLNAIFLFLEQLFWGKSCQVEGFSRLLKIFLGIWGLRISKYRQLGAVGAALCCGSVPVALLEPAAPLSHLGFAL